ncbi:MAG TPA: SusD/RagB family nutrient-binding outer membrane lipoprotein [Puia sp.]
MKNNKVPVWILLVAIVLMCSCNKKFHEDYQNLNQPSNVPPSTLLRSIELDLWDAPFDQNERNDQFTCLNYTYYGNNGYWDGNLQSQYAPLNYSDLQNTISMENEAAKADGTTNTPYHALGKFFRAFYFYQMTMKVGDLPLTQALQGTTVTQPVYDSQKSIFVQILSWLDSANTQMAGLINAGGNAEFSGDFYFIERPDNPLGALQAMQEWQKVINSFRLRVLVQLSAKASDPDLQVAQQFTNILSNPTQFPLMTSMDDNLQFEYINPYNIYPNSPSNFGNYSNRCNMAAAYLTTLSGLKDLRAMMTGEPARGLGFADTSFNSYIGAPSGQALSDMEASCANAAATTVSLINRHRYWETYTGENTFVVSYPEMCFNIAEGINRGWATGTAETWYIKGIQASQSFYGIVDGENTIIVQARILNGAFTDSAISIYWPWAGYYAQPAVKYAGDNAAGLNQILTQKYLAYFRNSGLEGYYQWRRTGVPAFNAGPGTGNSGIIPIRWQYPVSESSTNTVNYNAAVQSQYGGQDDINQQMWLLK